MRSQAHALSNRPTDQQTLPPGHFGSKTQIFGAIAQTSAAISTRLMLTFSYF
jgi:hypothetical protein